MAWPKLAGQSRAQLLSRSFRYFFAACVLEGDFQHSRLHDDIDVGGAGGPAAVALEDDDDAALAHDEGV